MNHVQNFYNRTLRQEILANGMKCIFVHDENQEDTAIRLNVGGGCESEPVGQSGISYLCLRVMFGGSMKYPGPKNFKEFITDCEIPVCTGNCIPSVYLESNVPEFALDEFLDRTTDAFVNPEFSTEALQYFVEKQYSQFYGAFRRDTSRAEQIQSITISGDKSFGTHMEELLEKKNITSLLRDYHLKYFRPSNMTLVMISNLPLDHQYSYTTNSLGTLQGLFEPLKPIRSLAWNCSTKADELLLTKTFTINRVGRIVVSYNLPEYTTVSSSLYLGYLIVKSDPGSLSYYLKDEGLITDVGVNHIYCGTLQMLRVEFEPTALGDAQVEKILNAMFTYLELVKKQPPSIEMFDQSRQYFLNLRAHEAAADIMDKIQAVFDLSKPFKLSPNTDDLLFPDVPRCFDPVDITKTALQLIPSNCAVTALSERNVNIQMHPRTELYLQYSAENLRIKPCCGIFSPPKPSIIFGTDENFIPTTGEVGFSDLSPALFAKALPTETRAALNLKIQSPNLAAFSPSVQELYASIVNHKMWLLSDGSTFQSKICAENNSLIVEVNSIPTALPRVFSVLIEILKAPIETKHLELLMQLRDEKIKIFKSFLEGDDSVDEDHYTERFLQNNHDIHAMISTLQRVNSIDDLPFKLQGSVTLLLCGKFNEHIVSKIHNYAKVISNPESSSHVTPRSGYRSRFHSNETCGSLTEPKTIKTNKNYSVCLKSIGIGPFSYTDWSRAVLLAQMLNIMVPLELMIRTGPTVTFNAQVIQVSGSIRILVKVLYSISGITLDRILNKCILECLNDFLDCPCESLVTNSRAKCANLLLNTKGDLQSEATRLWEAIKNGFSVTEYFTRFQARLWKTDLSNINSLCSQIITDDAILNAPTCLFLSASDADSAQELLTDVEMPLIRLYEPIAKFCRPSITINTQNASIPPKSFYTQRAEEEQTWCAKQLDDAILTANTLQALTRIFDS